MASGRVPKTIITLESIVIPFRFVSSNDRESHGGFNPGDLPTIANPDEDFMLRQSARLPLADFAVRKITFRRSTQVAGRRTRSWRCAYQYREGQRDPALYRSQKGVLRH